VVREGEKNGGSGGPKKKMTMHDNFPPQLTVAESANLMRRRAQGRRPPTAGEGAGSGPVKSPGTGAVCLAQAGNRKQGNCLIPPPTLRKCRRLRAAFARGRWGRNGSTSYDPFVCETARKPCPNVCAAAISNCPYRTALVINGGTQISKICGRGAGCLPDRAIFSRVEPQCTLRGASPPSHMGRY